MSASGPTTTTAADLEQLGRFFGRLLKSGAYAKVTVSVQDGRIGLVHCDQSFKVKDLPTE